MLRRLATAGLADCLVLFSALRLHSTRLNQLPPANHVVNTNANLLAGA